MSGTKDHYTTNDYNKLIKGGAKEVKRLNKINKHSNKTTQNKNNFMNVGQKSNLVGKNKFKDNLFLLSMLLNFGNEKQQDAIFRHMNDKQIKHIQKCLNDIIYTKIDIEYPEKLLKKIQPYKEKIHEILDSKNTKTTKKLLKDQKGGFIQYLLPFVIKTVLGL